jgi:DNA sulfur modification protein DndB
MDIINIPAIRGKIGTLTYYITVFTFEQIANDVKRINDELHSSTSLRDQIQRSLTDNTHKIKDYILSQSEHFFNSLVLAVYDGEPKWIEMEINFQSNDFYNIGFLQFNGEEKIFPVDGQHRVEGIKEALKENPDLADETIGIILIGHSKTPEGMEKSRRIFSTLNRYAKPVRLGDIIALDEDDIVAIVTRELLETYPLFMGNRVKVSNSKSIPHTDKESFTTLMTLYSCHLELLRAFCSNKKVKYLLTCK